MEASGAPKRPWWKRYELKFNIAGAVAALMIFIAGLLLNSAVLAGPGLLLLVFFCVHSVYAHVRRNL